MSGSVRGLIVTLGLLPQNKRCAMSPTRQHISDIYLNWKEEEGISKIITRGEVVKNDYNLSPSRYVAGNEVDDTLPLEDAVVLLNEAEEERREADGRLGEILKNMGLAA